MTSKHFVYAILVATAIFCSTNAWPDRATDKDVVADSYAAKLVFTDDGSESSRLSQVRAQNARLARERPDSIADAQLHFSRGLLLEELDELSVRLGVQVLSLTYKYPFGDNGRITTVSTGSAILDEQEGNFYERASKATALLRRELRQWMAMMPGQEGQARQVALEQPWKIYIAGVRGPIGVLATLDASDDVMFVGIPDTERIAEIMESLGQQPATAKDHGM